MSTTNSTHAGNRLSAEQRKTIAAAAAQDEYQQWRSRERLIGYATLIRLGELSIGSLSPANQDAVRDLLARDGYGSAADSRRLFLRQQRESKGMAAQHAKERAIAGIEAYHPRQEVYTAVVRTHLDGCEAGTYSSAKSSAEAVAGKKAPKLLRKSYSKKQLRKALRENEGHPGMQRIHAIADSSTITAMVSGSVSSCLGALANSHKLAQRLEGIEQEQVRAQRREKELQARIASLEARRDLEDAGKDWRTEAKRILAVEPGISNRELARRIGVSEGSIRKYLKSLEG